MAALGLLIGVVAVLGGGRSPSVLAVVLLVVGPLWFAAGVLNLRIERLRYSEGYRRPTRLAVLQGLPPRAPSDGDEPPPSLAGLLSGGVAALRRWMHSPTLRARRRPRGRRSRRSRMREHWRTSDRAVRKRYIELVATAVLTVVLGAVGGALVGWLVPNWGAANSAVNAAVFAFAFNVYDLVAGRPRSRGGQPN